MKKARIPAYIFILAAGFVLPACSLPEGFPGNIIQINKENQSEDVVSQPEPQASSESTVELSQEETEMLTLEYKDATEGLSKEEYDSLADLYETLGYVKSERDILEKSYRLFQNEAVLERLQEISVDITEETSEIQSMAELLISEDNILEAISREEWVSTMMPKLHDGKRTYFLAKDGKIETLIEVGALETVVSKVTVDGEGKPLGLVIRKSDRETVIYKENAIALADVYEIGNGSGERAFVKKIIDTYNGAIRIEEGSVKDGKLNGEFKVTTASFDAYDKVDIRKILEAVDTYDKQEYFGNFEDGKTTEEDVSEATKKALLKGTEAETVIAYAYNKDKTKCLFTGVTNTEKENGFIFDNAFLKLSIPKKVAIYEVKTRAGISFENLEIVKSDVEDTKKENTPVRVYDGEIQYYTGNEWVSVGTVSELEAKDPFRAYNEEKVTASIEEASRTVVNIDIGEVVKNTPAKETKKQSTPAAPVVVTPVVPVAPPPVVQPAPDTSSHEHEHEDEHEDEDESEPEPAPAPEPTPAPEPEPEPEVPAVTDTEPEIDAGALDDDEDWTPSDK